MCYLNDFICRYLVPLDFHETFDRVVDFLEHLESKGT